MSLRNLVPNGEKQRMYRGRGGETMRYGAMRLLRAICCNSDIKFPISDTKLWYSKTTKKYLDSVEESLFHAGESSIQYVAMEALSDLLFHRLMPEEPKLEAYKTE